jgi:hypothetical protein
VARPLTVSFGVRYDYSTPPHDKDDRANLYDPATGALVQVGTGNVPRGGYTTDGNNFGPRLGFAWSLDELQRWVVRGGYGIYYNQGSLATAEGLYFNPPYFNLGVYFPAPGLPATHAQRSVPGQLPRVHSTVGDRVSNGSADAVARALEREPAIPVGPRPGVRVRLRRLARPRLISARDLNQPQASPAVPNLRPNPMFADITYIESRASSKYNALQVKVPAADGRRPLGAGQLHLRQVHGRRVGILHERGRRQLPAEQPRPGR